MILNDKDKKELIKHILNESRGEQPPRMDEFESALFEEKVRAFLLKEEIGK